MVLVMEEAHYFVKCYNDDTENTEPWEISKIPFTRRNWSAERPCCILQVNRFLIPLWGPFSNGLEAI